MVAHILGKRVRGIKLPTKDSDNGNKIDKLKIGDIVLVKSSLPNNINKDEVFISQMHKTLGRTGLCRSVKRHAALIKFYDNETSLAEEWWYPLSYLSKEKESVTKNKPEKSKLEEKMLKTLSILCGLNARQLILGLLSHTSLSLDEGLLKITDLISLSTAEYLFTQSSIERVKPPLS